MCGSSSPRVGPVLNNNLLSLYRLKITNLSLGNRCMNLLPTGSRIATEATSILAVASRELTTTKQTYRIHSQWGFSVGE